MGNRSSHRSPPPPKVPFALSWEARGHRCLDIDSRPSRNVSTQKLPNQLAIRRHLRTASLAITRPLYDTMHYVLLQGSHIASVLNKETRFEAISTRFYCWQFKGHSLDCTTGNSKATHMQLPNQLAIRRPSSNRFSGNSEATHHAHPCQIYKAPYCQ